MGAVGARWSLVPDLRRPEPGMDGAEQQRIKSWKNQTVPNQGYGESTPSKQSLSEINDVLRKEKKELRSLLLEDLTVNSLQTVIKG